MRGIRHSAAVVGLAFGLVVGAAAPAAAEPVVTVTGLDAEQAAIVDWALALFDEAGLVLPPLDVVHHDTADECRGRAGRHVRAGRRSTVHLCTDEAAGWVELLVLHELAHAWEHAAVVDGQREAFMAWQGLDQWRVTDADSWHASGAEHAAVIMVWGLADRPVSPIQLPAYGCADLAAGYRLLTGQAPLHGFTDHC